MKDILLRVRWEKLYPPSSPRTRVIRHLADHGPGYRLSIAGKIYGEKNRYSGYSRIHQNIGRLLDEGILQKTGEERGERGHPKEEFGLTDSDGIIAAIAHAGPDLYFERLIKVNKKTFKNLQAVETFRAVWKTAGPRFSVRFARLAILAREMSEGEKGKKDLLDYYVDFLLSGITFPKLRKIVKESKPLQQIIYEIHEFADKLLLSAGVFRTSKQSVSKRTRASTAK